jgi:leucine dehydrogenase
LGAVGWKVAERLHAAGARLTVADLRQQIVERAAMEFGATTALPENVHAAEVDIYSPCALGGVITERTASAIRASAVAGAANNQLASPEAGAALAARGILYAPDFVINAGGIISGLNEYFKMPGRNGSESTPLVTRLARIYDRLTEIFQGADSERRSPEATAEQMARELIGRIRAH